MVKAPGCNLDERGHRPIHSVAKSESSRLEVIEALAHQRRVRREHCCGLAGYTVALPEPLHAPPDTCDSAGEFVTQDHGIVDAPAVLAMILMQIAAANSHGFHSQEDIFLPDLRDGNFPEFNRPRLLG